jgi:hypothetical protein
MSKTKFLCLDDEPDIPAKIRLLENAGSLTIELVRPVPDWADQIDQVHDRIRAGTAGLLIDFRLDETHSGAPKIQKQGKVVRYTAESLVTELRRRSIEDGKDLSYPIILWSTAKFLEKLYEVNSIVATTFDSIWRKDEVSDDRSTYATVLSSLARGYADLRRALKAGHVPLAKLLRCPESSLTRELDQYIGKRTAGQPYAFHYALFVLHDLLNVPGPLVTAAYVHALLGVEPLDERTWAMVVNKLGDDACYRGIFSDSHQRFWRHAVITGLETITKQSSWLSLTASERVKTLQQVWPRGRFTAAAPLGKGYSADFDCVSALSGRPLARRDGYRLLDARPMPWKEARYVAGSEYRKRYQELSRTKPLEADDAERFHLQYTSKT